MQSHRGIKRSRQETNESRLLHLPMILLRYIMDFVAISDIEINSRAFTLWISLAMVHRTLHFKHFITHIFFVFDNKFKNQDMWLKNFQWLNQCTNLQTLKTNWLQITSTFRIPNSVTLLTMNNFDVCDFGTSRLRELNICYGQFTLFPCLLIHLEKCQITNAKTPQHISFSMVPQLRDLTLHQCDNLETITNVSKSLISFCVGSCKLFSSTIPESVKICKIWGSPNVQGQFPILLTDLDCTFGSQIESWYLNYNWKIPQTLFNGFQLLPVETVVFSGECVEYFPDIQFGCNLKTFRMEAQNKICRLDWQHIFINSTNIQLLDLSTVTIDTIPIFPCMPHLKSLALNCTQIESFTAIRSCIGSSLEILQFKHSIEIEEYDFECGNCRYGDCEFCNEKPEDPLFDWTNFPCLEVDWLIQCPHLTKLTLFNIVRSNKLPNLHHLQDITLTHEQDGKTI